MNSVARLGTSTISLAALLLLATTAHALPTGGTVATGTASIGTAGSTMTINQSTAKAIIDWSTFDVGSTETVNFSQPNSSALTLNRIGDVNPSTILGQVNANGGLMLINPNGLLIGSTGSVNVASLVMTTTDINNTEFNNGNFAFNAAGDADATIEVDGEINIGSGGYAALVAPEVRLGSTGTITAGLGRVALAGTDVFTLDLTGDQLVNFALPSPITRSGPTTDKAEVNIESGGAIYAHDGVVQLSAKSTDVLIDSAINMDGYVQALHSINAGGEIELRADNVTITGDLDASADTLYGGYDPTYEYYNGGKIKAVAAKDLDFTGTAKAESAGSSFYGGEIYMEGFDINLGGVATTDSGQYYYPGYGYSFDDYAGSVTFNETHTYSTFNIGGYDAYTIEKALERGTKVYVLHRDTVQVNAPLSIDPAAPDHLLHFGDSNNDGDLHIALHNSIDLGGAGRLTGDADSVYLNAFYEPVKLQNAIDVARSTGGALIMVNEGDYTLYDGSYYEAAFINKPDLYLKASNNHGVNPNTGVRGYESVLNGGIVIGSNGDGTTIDGFTITGGLAPNPSYEGWGDPRTFGVLVDGASDVTIKNNIVGEYDPTFHTTGYLNQYYNIGIRGQIVEGLTIDSNHILSSFDRGIDIQSPFGPIAEYNVVTNNVVDTLNGMHVAGSSYITISDNTFNMAFPGYSSMPNGSTAGLILHYSNNAVVTDNVWNDYEVGITVNYSDDGVFTGGGVNDSTAYDQYGLIFNSSLNALVQIPVSGYTTAAMQSHPFATGSYVY